MGDDSEDGSSNANKLQDRLFLGFQRHDLQEQTLTSRLLTGTLNRTLDVQCQRFMEYARQTGDLGWKWGMLVREPGGKSGSLKLEGASPSRTPIATEASAVPEHRGKLYCDL